MFDALCGTAPNANLRDDRYTKIVTLFPWVSVSDYFLFRAVRRLTKVAAATLRGNVAW